MRSISLKPCKRYCSILAFTLWCLCVCHPILAQTKAKAISYQVTLALGYYDPLYYWQTDADTTVIYMEVDLYYDAGNRKTVSRILEQPEDFQLPLLELYYKTESPGEFLIDNANRFVFNIATVYSSVKSTGAKKTILGYKCKGYTFTDFQGINVFAYVAAKLPANICPWGNFNLEGTVLEMYTSNGYHYEATDMRSGQLPAGFFELPPWPVKSIATPVSN
jgi:GLPGLI family protein